MSPMGPALPPNLAVKRKLNDDADGSPSSGEESTRKRVLGPTRPEAKADAPSVTDSDSDSDSSSGFGPLPQSQAAKELLLRPEISFINSGTKGKDEEEQKGAAKRDEWMIIPPTQDDLAARLDPTKVRARKFNTGKSARIGGGSSTTGANSMWTETVEEKRKRLTDEVLGIAPAQTGMGEVTKENRLGAEKARRIKERTVGFVSCEEYGRITDTF